MNTAQGKLFFTKYKSVNNCKVVNNSRQKRLKSCNNLLM